MKKAWVLSDSLSAQRRLWSDFADAKADFRLHWEHRSFCWFCRAADAFDEIVFKDCWFCRAAAQLLKFYRIFAKSILSTKL